MKKQEQKKVNGSLALKSPCVVVIPANTPEQTRKLRVAAYARVSSNSEDQLNSYAAQNAHYTELITSNPEWEFVDIYADKGITGTSAEKREDFQRLLADCRRGRIDRILVKSSSRFARNAKECLEAVRELKALDVSVCFEEQNIDTAELSGELLVAIFAMIDQKESENISDNTRWGVQQRMANGTYIPSSLPFGYKKNQNGEIIIDEIRANYIHKIYTDFLNGRSTEEIAKDLSKQQKTTPVLHSYQWTVHAIARILKNETYTGNFLWQKSFRTSTLPRHYKINRGEKQKYLALHSHPEIIDQDMFQQVQTLLNKRKEKFFTAEIKQSPLRGYLECGCCGSAFRTRTTRGIIYHVCRTHDAGKELCRNRQIPEFTIQGSFLRLYYKLKHQGTSLLSCLLADLQAARTGKMLWSVDIVELNDQIADITRQDRLLTQLKHQGLVDPDIFISRRDALAEQLRAVKLEKERLLESEENPTIHQTRVLLETLEAAPEFLDTFDEELFREIVDKIIVESNERLRFRLINGLELTEDIERTVR